MKKACRDHWLFWSHVNDVKSAELALVPFSKFYHLIKYTGQGTIGINFDL